MKTVSIPLAARVRSSASPAALAAASVLLALPANAQTTDADDYHTTEEIVVTAPFVRSLDVLGHVTVVETDELAKSLKPQIGDTLTAQAGVSATSFTPGASRPVLRGFQGERVRVLTDGIGSIDASNTSADHAVTVDPLTAERIEILRGPAVLLFGSQAIGGAVNIFDRRIPRKAVTDHVHFDLLAGYGTAARDRSVAGSADVQVASRLVLHADGSWRKTAPVRGGDGWTLAPALRASVLEAAADALAEGHTDEAAELTDTANARGKIPGTQSETWTAGVGASIVTDTGHLGISVARFASDYGIPTRPLSSHAHEEGAAEEEHAEATPVTIGMRQWRADLRGEVELGGSFLNKVRVRAGFSDYTHTEYEGDEVGTVFTNSGLEARVEVGQADRGGWSGASGVHFYHRAMDAVGAEAFIPQNATEQLALFTLQEWQSGPLGAEIALRWEDVRVSARRGTDRRHFSSLSGAAGVNYDVTDAVRLSASIARAVRAPAAEELFSDGPHIATQSYELGDTALTKERSTGGEVSVRYRGTGVRATLTGYANWFDNFIYAAETGNIVDDLPEFRYAQRDAKHWGIEFDGNARLGMIGPVALSADLVADMTRATLKGGGAVPRIPPMRVLGALEGETDRLSARIEVERTWTQNRVAAFETPTKGFTLVNASAEWKPFANAKSLTIMLSANNLFDRIARRHASYTKDFVPLTGRDIRVSVRASF